MFRSPSESQPLELLLRLLHPEKSNTIVFLKKGWKTRLAMKFNEV
jgi:superfamily II DNA/RNA helicase